MRSGVVSWHGMWEQANVLQPVYSSVTVQQRGVAFLEPLEGCTVGKHYFIFVHIIPPPSGHETQLTVHSSYLEPGFGLLGLLVLYGI